MTPLLQRVLSDLDLAALSKQWPRPLDELVERLNAQCQPAHIPRQMTAQQILFYTPHKEVFMGLLTKAAAGESVQALAQALLSDAGTTVYEDGFDPPYVTNWDVANEVYNPDGSEITE